MNNRPFTFLALVVSKVLFFLFLFLTIFHPMSVRTQGGFAGTTFAQGPPPQQITSHKDGAEMRLIPIGDFEYGIDQIEMKKIVVSICKEKISHFFETEYPKQKKNLPAYYMDRFEVTNAQYARFLKETGHREPRYWKYSHLNSPRQPVVGVGWADAEAYAKWAGKRLPTEEEWEKGARGTYGRNWPWGNEPDDKRFNGRKKDIFLPIIVGSIPTGNSPFGLSDMAGNVWEMTSGLWQGIGKAMRGGGYLNTNAEVRVTVRWATKQEEEGADWLGFRCVMDVGNINKFGRW
jgi:iron(II)-dependent oxidoreductase